IDTIVISHGHWDHVGGIFDTEGNFVYPNARYVIWQSEYEYWTAPEQFVQTDQNPAISVWAKLQGHKDKIRLIGQDGDEAEVVPGVCAIAAPGHTIGHVALTVESGSDRLIHIVDASHTPVQLDHSIWSPQFDYDKAQAGETRRKLFERAARDKAQMQT